MDYSKYSLYKAKNLISIDLKKSPAEVIVQSYNPITGELEISEVFEISEKDLDELIYNLNKEKENIEKKIEEIKKFKLDIVNG